MADQPTPEQIKELNEKLKNMSPEELRDFQKKQCIFCQIVNGRVQSKKVYEDEHSIGILDINPANPGHLLLLPKEHYSIMPQLPKPILDHLFIVSKNLSNTLLRSIDAKGSNIIVQNGIAAGQKAQHFMIHIIPRKEKDGLAFELAQKPMDEKTLDSIHQILSSDIGSRKKESPSPLLSIQHKIKEAHMQEHKERTQKAAASHPNNHSHHHHPHHNPKSKPSKKQSMTKSEKSDEISLDDIASLLGKK